MVRSQAFTACKSLSFFFVSLSNICPSIGRGPTRRASLEAGVASSRGFLLLLLLVLTRDAKQTQNGYKGGSGKANGHLEMEDPCLRRSIEFNRSLAECLQADAVPGSLRWPYRRTDYRFATRGKKAALGVLCNCVESACRVEQSLSSVLLVLPPDQKSGATKHPACAFLVDTSM